MHTRMLSVIALALVALPNVSSAQASQEPANKTHYLAAELLNGYKMVQRNLLEAAEKMPEEHYGFKATPEVRPFGQLVAHAALVQFGSCAMLKGEPSPRKDEKEDATRTRTQTIALLKAATEYCDPLMSGITDANSTELVKSGDSQAARALFPMSVIAHGLEMYGTMAVYLRLKGIVPPSTERQKQMMKDQPKKSE